MVGKTVRQRGGSARVRGWIAVTLIFVLVVSIFGAGGRAAAATINWWAQSTASESFQTSEDAALDVPLPMRQDWGRFVYLPDPSTAWPVTISVDTALDPTKLTASPAVVPVASGATTTYTWSTTTGVFTNISASSLLVDNPGFSLTRELVDGRRFAGLAVERRHFTVRFAATRALASYNLLIQFLPNFGTGSTIPPLPVVPSDVACTPGPTTVPGDAIRPQWVGSAAPGSELRIECDVTLTNTSTSQVLYMPMAFVSEGSSSSTSLPLGSTSATHDDPVLGRTEFAVSPPPGVSSQGAVSSFRSRYLVLNYQDEVERGIPWYASYNRGLNNDTYEPGDTLTNDPRSFRPQSFMYVQSPGWPGEIEVRTDVPTMFLQPFPSVTPTVVDGHATYMWSGSTSFFSATLRDSRLLTQAPGFTMTRALIGGRDLAPLEVVDREFHVDINVVDAAQSLSATIVFQPSFFPPGATVPPVVASNISCPTGAPNPGSPGIVNWFNIPGTSGTVAHLVCTVRLENTSASAARYIPDVNVQAIRSSFQSPPANMNSIGADDPALGLILYRVTPPEATVAEATLFRYDTLNVSLGGENQSDQPIPWSARFTEVFQFGTSDNAVPDVVRPYELSWEFLLQKPITWPAAVTVATSLDTAGWFLSPIVTPTTSGDVKTYRWEQSGSFVQAFMSSQGFNPETRVSTPASLGASVVREAVGGSRIEAGATVQRSFVISLVGTTTTTVDVSAFVTSGTAGTPNPVTVTNAQCDGGQVLGGSPGGFGWFNTVLPQGTEVRLNCSATLTNTASQPGTYLPVVMVTRSTQTVAPAQTGNAISFSSTPLGAVTFEVTPPVGTHAQGTLTNAVRHTVFLFPTNRALVPTQLTYTGATSAFHGEPVTLAARLSHTDGRFPVIARPVRFDVDGATYTAITSSDGLASVTLPSGLGAVGAHTVTVTFAEDEFFLGSSLAATITVEGRSTTLTYIGDTSATFGFARIAGHLVDTRTGAPLPGQTLSFSIDGTAVGTATTDPSGNAVLASPPATRLLPGVHTIGLSFAGDSTRAASNASAVLTVVSSAFKVSAGGVTTNGVEVGLSAKSDGTHVSGDLDLRTSTRHVSLHTVVALGLSTDRTMASLYGRTAAGEDVVAFVTDAGKTGSDDRIIVMVDGIALTGDGSLRGGNVAIKDLKE